MPFPQGSALRSGATALAGFRIPPREVSGDDQLGRIVAGLGLDIRRSDPDVACSAHPLLDKRRDAHPQIVAQRMGMHVAVDPIDDEPANAGLISLSNVH